MARKYKLTGCAKFFIFFIIAAPLAYIGASYYNGQDPIKEAREFFQSFGTDDSSDPVTKDKDSVDVTMDQNVNAAPPQTTEGSVYQEMELKDLEIKSLKNDLKDCETLNNKQKQLIETQKMEIKNLKQQLEAS